MSDFQLPDFASIPLTSEQVLEAVRFFVGLPYSEKQTYLNLREDGSIESGSCNCYGLLFLVAMRLGLLPHDFLSLLARAFAQRPAARVLRDYLARNGARIERDKMQPGDVVLFRFDKDEEEERLEKQLHHIAFFSSAVPLPLGSIIHALDTDALRDGHVSETGLNADDNEHIVSIWRFRNCVQEEVSHG